MGKIAVIYGSKYGTTQKYAEWIAEELSAEIFDEKSMTLAKLIHYDTLIYAGALYTGGIRGISLIRKNFEQLRNKNLIVFTCGLVGLECTETFAGRSKCIDRMFSQEMQKNIKFFHLNGAIEYKKLSFVHKFMMATVKKKLLEREPTSLQEWEKLLLDTYGKKIDLIDKNSIEEITSYVKNSM